MGNRSSRREFLRRLAATGAGAYALANVTSGCGAQAQPGGSRARVVIVRSDALGPFEGRPQPDQSGLAEMLSRGICRLTDEQSPAKAWARVFRPEDRVSIKVNCLGGPRCSTRPELANAVVDAAQAVGVAGDDIIVWDRRDRELVAGGFYLNRDQPGAKCYGTEDDYGEETTHRSFNGRISRILSDRTTALVNLPILKDHNGAGVTIALKNHYGTCNNPGAHHGNGCDPYLADLNDLEVIRTRTRIVICDALQAVVNGGPGLRSPEFLWDYKGILLGFDPLAIDVVGWGLIEQRRAETGLPSLEAAGRKPKWIATAAERGIGVGRAEDIEVIELTV